MIGEESKVDKLGSHNEVHLKFNEEIKPRRKNEKEKRHLCGSVKDDLEVNGVGPLTGTNLLSDDVIGSGKRKSEEENIEPREKIFNKLKKKKAQLLKEAAKADKRGVCYLSRIPPHMDPSKLRHILSQYGEIQRIYLAPADSTVQILSKRAGRLQDQQFSEGWVEFTNKCVAKRVANMLNGGRKRSQFFYDLWNIKYLSKFKWDDLTEDIAYKKATREQKLALEISAAKRERDFYLNKVDKSLALTSIEERLKKKQKLQKEFGGEEAPKVIRQFPQKKPVVDKSEENRSQLSKDILAGVFGVSH